MQTFQHHNTVSSTQAENQTVTEWGWIFRKTHGHYRTLWGACVCWDTSHKMASMSTNASTSQCTVMPAGFSQNSTTFLLNLQELNWIQTSPLPAPMQHSTFHWLSNRSYNC